MQQFKFFYIKNINNIGNIFKKYLTNFSLLIFTNTKDDSIDIQNDNNYIFAMNKTYELKTTLVINKEIKINNNNQIMFCYSEFPLELKIDKN